MLSFYAKKKTQKERKEENRKVIEQSIRGFNPTRIIFDELADINTARTVSAEGGALTANMITDMYERITDQHGRPEISAFVTEWKKEYLCEIVEPTSEAGKRIKKLELRIKGLEDENYNLKEELEYYKMLTQEN